MTEKNIQVNTSYGVIIKTIKKCSWDYGKVHIFFCPRIKNGWQRSVAELSVRVAVIKPYFSCEV
jgi:hypothetical protein